MKKISALLFIILGLPILAANFIISGGARLERKVEISVGEGVLVRRGNMANSFTKQFPNSFSATQQTHEVLKNTDNETQKIYDVLK